MAPQIQKQPILFPSAEDDEKQELFLDVSYFGKWKRNKSVE